MVRILWFMILGIILLTLSTLPGYARAAARSQSINLILGRKVVPDNFYQKVDELTAYVANIFQDIFALTQVFDDGDSGAIIDNDFKRSRENRIGFMYSELHFIIAHAAYFAVCMRRSSSIFHILSATPAARMDYPIESQACYELYKLSKEEAERREKIKTAEAKVSLEALKTAGATPEEIAAETKNRRIAAHYRMRGAKVKFAVWPMITRYIAENIGIRLVHSKSFSGLNHRPNPALLAPPTQDDIEGGEGQRIVEIGKCIVIYYQGIIYPKPFKAGEAFESDGLPLLAYLESEKPHQSTATWQKISRRRFLLRCLAVAMFAISYGSRSWFWEQLVITRSLVFISIATYLLFCIWTGYERIHNCIRNVLYTLMLSTTAKELHRSVMYLGNKEFSWLRGVHSYSIVDSPWKCGGTLAVLAIAGIVVPRSRNTIFTGLYGTLVSCGIWWLYNNSLGTTLYVNAIGY